MLTTVNYDGEARRRTGTGAGYFKDDTAGNIRVGCDSYKQYTDHYRGFFRYSLADLPAGANVLKVRLKISVNAVGGASHLLDVHPYNGNGQADPEVDTEQTLYDRCAAGTPYVDDSTEFRTTGTKWFTLGDGENAQACIDVENAKSAVNRFSLGLHEEGDDDAKATLDALEGSGIESQLEITYEFAAKQGHFKWYKNGWQTEDGKLTGVQNGDDLRFRVCLHELGGSQGLNLDIDVKYSSDKLNWVPLASQGVEREWITPTGHEESAQWYNEANAYDDNTATAASQPNVAPASWTAFLVLTHSLLTSKRLRYWVTCSENIDLIDVDIHKDGAWVDVYQGSITTGQWVTKTFSKGSVDKIRMRFHNMSSMTSGNVNVYEVDFSQEALFRWRDDPNLTDLANIDQARLSCTTENGKVHENACTNCENVGGNAHHEISIILEPYVAEAGATYYFRAILEGKALDLDAEVSEYVNCEISAPPPSVGYCYSNGLFCVQVAG